MGADLELDSQNYSDLEPEDFEFSARIRRVGSTDMSVSTEFSRVSVVVVENNEIVEEEYNGSDDRNMICKENKYESGGERHFHNLSSKTGNYNQIDKKDKKHEFHDQYSSQVERKNEKIEEEYHQANYQQKPSDYQRQINHINNDHSSSSRHLSPSDYQSNTQNQKYYKNGNEEEKSLNDHY